jgi:hypothetical protein
MKRTAAVLAITLVCVCRVATAFAGPSAPAGDTDWTRCVPGMGGVPTERVRRVASPSPELAALQPVIARLFAPQEQALRLSGPNLADAPITIVGVYASTTVTLTEYYFEASKAVRDEATEVPGEEGLLRVMVTGWLRGQGAAVTSLGTKGDMMWAELDRPGATDARAELLPLGILRRGATVVWALKRATPAGGLRFYELGASSVRRRDAANLQGC